MRNLALIAVPFALALGLSAQTMLSSHASFAAPRPAAHALGMRESASHAPDFRSGSGTGFHGRRTNPGSFIYPFGYFDDSFYSDTLLSTGYPLAAEPPTIIVQPPAESPRYEAPTAPSQPLMIELQGDRYVRVSGENTSSAQMLDKENSQSRIPRRAEQPSGSRTSEAAAPDLSPVILVFRDGHREEVSDYTIADGVLYTRADDYSSGPWNKNIKISALNVSETLASNRSRGNNFRLPTAPNEVIVRP
jgi:hypothetical protein